MERYYYGLLSLLANGLVSFSLSGFILGLFPPGSCNDQMIRISRASMAISCLLLVLTGLWVIWQFRGITIWPGCPRWLRLRWSWHLLYIWILILLHVFMFFTIIFVIYSVF